MDIDPIEDQLVTRLPIRYSNCLEPNVHIHQFPLLTRPLQVPPSAAAAGKRIRARVKPGVRRLEVHVPVDTRPEVWNAERGVELGQARVEDDREKNQETQVKTREGEEPRLAEVRLQSERITHRGAYMLGIVRDGQLHLHPISETHQFRPTLTYLDILSRKGKRSRGGADDSDSDDGPPPDPDEPAPVPTPKKERKPAGEAKEVQVAARKAGGDDKLGTLQGGMSAARREMLMAIRAEEDEAWEDLEFFHGETEQATEAFESVFSTSSDQLECKSEFRTFLKDMGGL